MNEHDIDNTIRPGENGTEINVNLTDGAVAVDEKNRTVLLTEKETIVVEKPDAINIIPSNRPRKVYMGMWGPLELGALAAASLVVISALAMFFFGTLPAKRELEQNRATRDRLERELISAREKYGTITSTESQVAKLVASANDFEMQFLPIAANGRTALYQRINGLIAAHGLLNTTGPDYAALEIAEQGSNNQSEEERGRAKFRSLFPGAYVTMTVEGSYQNLRRFIREIETGREFVIISAVELEPSDSQEVEKNTPAQQPLDDAEDSFGGFSARPGTRAPASAQPTPQKGRTLGGVVSLRLEMAAYFRRSNAAPAMPAPEQQQ